MYIAILSSVTVSIGEERSGVLREILFVTGESRVTEEAGKPSMNSQYHLVYHEDRICTNVARQYQKVIVGQSTMLLGVK